LPALRTGAYERLDDGDDGSTVAFARSAEGGRLVIVANSASAPDAIAAGRLRDWLEGPAQVIGTYAYSGAQGSAGRNGLTVPPRSVVVVGRSDSRES
jgi:hypothetical protein